MSIDETLTLPVGVTLDRFIKRQQSAFKGASGELSQLLRDIGLAAKIINREVNRAGLIDLTGGTDSENIQGEAQQKLDVIANVRLIRALKNGGEVCAIITEEDEGIIYTGNNEGKYVVALDPLDGSSNIDVNVSIGTIFSIYHRISPEGTLANEADFLQGGRSQVAAGYILYGSSTILVYSTGKGVNCFTYENSLGEFFLSHTNVMAPKNGNIFSINYGNYTSFFAPIKKYLSLCLDRSYSSRYIGSLVGDFHRNQFKGGIYLYPPTNEHLKGKLRLLYECYPLAFLAEDSGARATDGYQEILDIEATSFHQRSPLYVGSELMVKELMELH
jgi:fructose-1,6-bisphosphatase I